MKSADKILIAFLAVLLLSIGVYAVLSNTVSHQGDKVEVLVGSTEKTLQESINDGTIFVAPIMTRGSVSYSTKPSPGHTGMEIVVAIGNTERKLQEAIDSRQLCQNVGARNFAFTTTPVPGSNGYQVSVAIGGTSKALQDAIDSGYFCAQTVPPSRCGGLPCQELDCCPGVGSISICRNGHWITYTGNYACH